VAEQSSPAPLGIGAAKGWARAPRVARSALTVRIGVFDSGLGGLSTLVACLRYLPEAEYFFFGDVANAPYGDKEPAAVRRWTAEAYRRFLALGVDAVVLACNSATSAAAAPLRAQSPVPILGLEPAIKKALAVETGPVLLLATTLTVTGAKLQRLLEDIDPARRVEALACPGLMEIIEEQRPNWRALAQSYWRERLEPRATQLRAKALVLGCTHYCWLEDDFRQWLGPDGRVYDGNDGLARHLWRRLRGTEAPTPGELPARARIRLDFSADAQRKRKIARDWLASRGVQAQEPVGLARSGVLS